jgi:hypothetical protein
MDFGVYPVAPLEKAVQALAEAVETVAAEPGADANAPATPVPTPTQADTAAALVRGGFVERVLGDTHAAVAAPPADAPGVRVDRSVETANLQTFARPHAAVAEPTRPADTVSPSGTHANPHEQGDFALPLSLLVPATLTGLQVEHAATWPLPGRGTAPDPKPLHRARTREREARPPPPMEDPQEEAPELAPEHPGRRDAADQTCDVVFEDDAHGAWCEELTQALRSELAARVPPHALLLAAEQWRRGRCVVLACPQAADAAGSAWAFVLWPRRQAARPDGSAPPRALHGLRVEARLQWSALPSGVRWWQVRVIKEHHPRSGRQLIPAAPAGPTGRLPCDVQLGPVLARPLRCCDVCVRIHAARRFWNALGTQWSMHVVVASFPLLGSRASKQEAPC